MTDMIEQVARAIFNAIADFSGAPRPTDAEWNESDPESEKFKRVIGVSAIKAMREPTDDMVSLGEHCADACYKIDPCGDGARHIWRTMIGEALESE